MICLFNVIMRNFYIYTLCIFLTSCCASEPPQQPNIKLNINTLDPEAASVIEKAQLNAVNSPTSMQSWQTFGKLLHAHGLDHEAQLAYSYANQLQHTSETTYLHAVVCAETGDYEQAIALCNGISSYTPALWQQGYWLLDLGKLSEAKKKFDLAVEQDPAAVAALVGNSRVLIALGDFGSAIEVLRDIQLRGGSHPYITFLLGTAFQRKGEVDIAIPLLQAPMPGPPIWDDPWLKDLGRMKTGFAASLNRATNKLDNGNLEGALADLKNLHKHNPENVTVTNNLGSVYLQMEKPQEAMNVIAKGLKHTPNHAPSHFSIGLALMQLQSLDKAEESMLTAIRLQPAFAPAYVSAGKIALIKKDLNLARAHLEKAMSIGTNNPNDRQMLAMTYLDLRMNFEAIQQFDLVLQANPSQTMSIGGKAVALARLGQKEKAMKILREANLNFPNNSNIQRAMNVVFQSGNNQ